MRSAKNSHTLIGVKMTKMRTMSLMLMNAASIPMRDAILMIAERRINK
jgi:hypothetical protein